MRLSREHLLFLLLFGLLIGLAVISAIQRAQNDRQNAAARIPFSTHSAEGSGMLAFKSWLDAAGYRTERIEFDAFRVSDETRALALFDPYIAPTDADVSAINSWVERGNTLIVAEQYAAQDDRMLRALRVGLNFLDRRAITATLEQPILGQLRGTEIKVRAATFIATERTDYVSYLNAEGKPLLITFPQGKGRVWFASAPELFDNQYLEEEANAALVFALFSRVPRGSLIAFDEYHLGLIGSSAGQSRSIQQLLFTTSWGWGILYALVIGLTYLFVNGKRFGRVVPLQKDIERRNPAEYVTSMANLYRRAGKRGLIARHYYRQLKRALAKPYRLNADLPDVEFVEELARYREGLDRDAVLKTLRALQQPKADERALVKLADETIRLMTR